MRNKGKLIFCLVVAGALIAPSIAVPQGYGAAARGYTGPTAADFRAMGHNDPVLRKQLARDDVPHD